jgi:hypothetical protein
MGFLSTVPADAGDKMKSAVAAASSADGNFPGQYYIFWLFLISTDILHSHITGCTYRNGDGLRSCHRYWTSSDAINQPDEQ